MSLIRLWGRHVAGATAVEFALIAPLFLAFLFGVLQGGMMLWTQLALQQATERAARCASTNAFLCGTALQTKDYAVSQSLGRGIPRDSFTATTQACGSLVSGEYTVQLLADTIRLRAQSCFPK